MYEMSEIPTKKDRVMGSLASSVSVSGDAGRDSDSEEGVIGVYSGRNKISLHAGALVALQEQYCAHKYPGMKVCFASSADTPFAEQVGRATLQLLEIVPGVTIWQRLMQEWEQVDVNQIGRQPPLSRYVYYTVFMCWVYMTSIQYSVDNIEYMMQIWYARM